MYMSTKIEDLSDSEEEYFEDEDDYREDIHDEDIIPVKHKKTKEKFGDNLDSVNMRIINMLIEKIKHPALVSFIMLLLTHPLLIQGIFRIPYVEVADNTIGINVILSILGGIIFFIIRELI